MDREMLLFLRNYLGYLLELEIENVLFDSNEEPTYSAVFTTNLAKCYIELSMQLGIDTPQSVKEIFDRLGYSASEFAIFETKRSKEAEYYLGLQF